MRSPPFHSYLATKRGHVEPATLWASVQLQQAHLSATCERQNYIRNKHEPHEQSFQEAETTDPGV